MAAGPEIDPTISRILEIIGGKSFDESFFRRLRDLPYDEQEKKLVEIFGDPKVGIPNGNKVGRSLAKINNIHWSASSERVKKRFVKAKANEIQDRLFIKRKPLKIVPTLGNVFHTTRHYVHSEVFVDARASVSNVIANVATESNRNNALKTVRVATMAASRNAGIFVGINISNYTDFIVVEDLMAERGYTKNPFEPELDIYKQGLVPFGQTDKNFVVYQS